MAVKLGLEIEGEQFLKAELAVEALKLGLEKIVEIGKEAAEALFEMVEGAVETSDELKNTAQSIGVTTDALQELQYAGLQSNIEASDLTQSIRILSRTMYEAKEGAGEQGKAFSKLGVKVTDAHGKLRSADEVIGDLADKFAKLPDGAEKTALSMQLFGRAGARMVPLLNEGKEGIAELRQEAHDLGFVLDEELIKQGAEVDELGKSLKAVWTGIKNQVGSALFPVLIKAGKAMREWLLTNREWIKQKLESVLNGIAAAGKFVYETFALIARNADLIKYAIAAAIIGFAVLKAASIEAAAAALGAWLEAAAPFIAIGAAITGLLLLLDDLRLYAKYGDKAHTITGQFVKAMKEFEKPGANDPWWLRVLKDFTKTLREAIELLKELNGESKIARVDKDTAMSKQDIQWRADKQTLESAKNRLKMGLPLTAKEHEAIGRLQQIDPAVVPGGEPELIRQYTPAGIQPQATARPEYRPQDRGGTVSNVQTNYVEVHAAPGQSTEDIGQMVVDKLNQHWDDKMEEAAPGGAP